MSAYLSAAEYAAYGLPASATAVSVRTASGLLDAYLGRPEGLVWLSDACGRPSLQAGLTPTLSLKAASAFAAGTAVVVTLPYAVSPSLAGEVVVLDRASETLREACLVTAVNGASITLAAVAGDHAASATLETGLVLSERLSFGFSVGAAFLSRHPVARVLALVVRSDGRDRLGPRLSAQSRFFRLGAVPDFVSTANPSCLTVVPPDGYRCDPATGELTFLAATRSLDVRVSYMAGYASDCLPTAIKTATATLAAALDATADLPAGVKAYQAGDTAIERFAETQLSADLLRAIEPFKATHGL